MRVEFGPGSVMGANAAAGSLTCWEMFKLYGSSIHAVEAFVEAGKKETKRLNSYSPISPPGLLFTSSYRTSCKTLKAGLLLEQLR